MDRLALHEGTAAAFAIVDATNEYIAESAPWTLAKDPSNGDRVMQILFDAAEALRLAAVLLDPVMPSSSAEILRRVGAGGEPVRWDRDSTWRSAGERQVASADPLWPRLDLPSVPAAGKRPGRSTTKEEKTVSESPDASEKVTASAITSAPESAASPTASAVQAAAPASAAPPSSERISIDDFMKVDLRVARVLAAERVPKSKKLLKLHVDTGADQRTIVAGIAEAYEPDGLVGRTVVVVANLQPAKLMGIESNGMVLAGSVEGGSPVLVDVGAALPPGARVR